MTDDAEIRGQRTDDGGQRGDSELLRRYAEEGSEDAFGEVVRRRVDLVYGAAWRQVRGNGALAEEITQGVFVELARKAGRLARHELLVGWLHTATRFAAAKALRAESRRRAREREAWVMSEVLGTDDAVAEWERLRPVIDEALGELKERERAAILLRYFEKRPLAEVGAALALTETAARSCVDRALDKLHAALARRGITSTTAALGVALVNQVSVAAPAGLAASATGAALAGMGAVGATVVGGSLASGLVSLTFMSATKFTGGTIAALAVLGASLVANAYLWSRPAPAVGAAVTATAEETVGAEAGAVPVTDLVKRADLAGLRDQLRAAGASEAVVRAALEGILRRRYREQLSSDRAARLKRGWWRDDQRTWGTANDIQLPFDDLRLINQMVTRPLEELLGVDPLDEAEADARYAFLPAELRREFGRIDRVSVGGWVRSGDAEVDAVLEAELERNRHEVTERRKALMAALTPEQRTDYEMRFGPFASGLARQLEQVAVTEQEFRAVFPIADSYAKESAEVAKRGDAGAMKVELDRRTVQQLIAALGYDRALDFIWAGSTEYPAYARVARDANLPSATAGRVMQLAAETADRAGAIHADGALTVEQKRAELRALQATARAQLDAMLPVAAQQRLAPTALTWINGLGDGRYKTIPAVLPGQVRSTVFGGARSVDGPLSPGQNSPRAPLVPARAAGK